MQETLAPQYDFEHTKLAVNATKPSELKKLLQRVMKSDSSSEKLNRLSRRVLQHALVFFAGSLSEKLEYITKFYQSLGAILSKHLPHHTQPGRDQGVEIINHNIDKDAKNKVGDVVVVKINPYGQYLGGFAILNPRELSLKLNLSGRYAIPDPTVYGLMTGPVHNPSLYINKQHPSRTGISTFWYRVGHSDITESYNWGDHLPKRTGGLAYSPTTNKFSIYTTSELSQEELTPGTEVWGTPFVASFDTKKIPFTF